MSGVGGRVARIIVCEDDGRFRRVLLKILGADPSVDVVGEAGTGEEACGLLATLQRVDLMLLDLELPGIDGIEVVRRVRRDQRDVEVLIFTSFRDEDRVFDAIEAGAAGYLVKGIAPRRLREAIAEVLAGGTVIDAQLGRRFWSLFASAPGRQPVDVQLTAEELEVLTVVARGLSNPEAAEALGTSRRSVKAYLASIYRKLGVKSRVGAVVKALNAGLIEL